MRGRRDADAALEERAADVAGTGAALDRVFDDLKGVFAQRDRYPDPAAHKAALVARLGEVFDGFAHIETGRNLDQKM